MKKKVESGTAVLKSMEKSFRVHVKPTWAKWKKEAVQASRGQYCNAMQ